MLARLFRFTTPLLLVALSCAPIGCGGGSSPYDEPIRTLPPVAIGASLVFVETAVPVAHVVRISESAVETRRVPVGPNPVHAIARSGEGAEEVLVLSRGERDLVDEAPVPSTLTRIPLAAETEPRVYEIGSPFNAVAQSPDGRYAVVYFRESAELDRLLFNPNEIAIIDLEQDPTDGAARLRTVRSFGGVPLDVVFSPTLVFGGVPRTLAVVLAGSYVTLIDLDHPDRSEWTVRLTREDDPRQIRPRDVLFHDRDLYVRSEASDDVYAISLRELAPEEQGSNDYRPFINELATSGRPDELAAFEGAEGLRLMSVSTSVAEASIMNPETGSLVRVPLAASANRIHLYDGTAPVDPEPRPRALLVNTGSSTQTLSFLDLDDIEERLGQNVETLHVGRRVTGVLPLPAEDDNVVLLVHEGTSPGLSLVNLDQRTLSPIHAEVSLEAATFGAGGTRVWVAPPGTHHVGWLDLTTFHPGEVRLDAPTEHVAVVRSGTEEWLAVLHPSTGGWLTLLPVDDPSRRSARSIEGFFFEGLLSGREP